MIRDGLRPFGISTAHTRAVIASVPETRPDIWDKRWDYGVRTLREQLAHLALVRESTLTTLTKGNPNLLAAIYGEAPWIAGSGRTSDLLLAWDLHSQTCESLMMNVRQDALDVPFVTEFGNVSKPSNYLRLMLLEETHHRAQMILQLRLLGLDPPEFPGRAWAELGV